MLQHLNTAGTINQTPRHLHDRIDTTEPGDFNVGTKVHIGNLVFQRMPGLIRDLL